MYLKWPTAFVPQHSDFLIAAIWSAMAPAHCNLKDARGWVCMCVCERVSEEKREREEEEE